MKGQRLRAGVTTTIYALILLGAGALAACQSTSGAASDPVKRAEKNATARQLAVEYLNANAPAVAVEWIQKVLADSPDDVDAHILMARAMGMTKEGDQAFAHLDRALDLDPGNPFAQNLYGVLLCGEGSSGDALGWFELAALNPREANPAAAYENGGLCLYQAGRRAESERWFVEALRRDATRTRASCHLAKILFGQSRLSPARAHAAACVASPATAPEWRREMQSVLGNGEALR